jgi:glycosyltransferase involved in cell wall biosynthesis
MKIAYVTTGDAGDIHCWSGLNRFIAQSLIKQGADVYFIDRLKPKQKSPADFISKAYHKILFNKNILLDRTSSNAIHYAKQIKQRIKPDTDIIFSPGSIVVSMLDTPHKKVFYTDANFQAMIDYYPDFMNIARSSIKSGNDLEKSALQNCDLAIYASEWAAESAAKFYGINRNKIKVVPFGANIECSCNDESKIRQIIKNKPRDRCNLLFCGVDFVRKGGEIALRAAQIIKDRGISVKLDIVGVGDEIDLPDFAVNHGFISKSSDEGQKKLDKLFSEAHFFILPTRAECYGLVFCEAASFGLPSVTTRTGGVITIIRDGINGAAFDLSAPPEKYAGYIINLFNDFEEYEKLSISSFNDYKTRLNWDIAGKTVMKMISDL